MKIESLLFTALELVHITFLYYFHSQSKELDEVSFQTQGILTNFIACLVYSNNDNTYVITALLSRASQRKHTIYFV